MKKTKFVGVNGDEIFLMEGKNNTVEEQTQNYPKSDGTQGVMLHTYWTQKGRLFLYELLKSKGYIPDIEKEYGKEA